MALNAGDEDDDDHHPGAVGGEGRSYRPERHLTEEELEIILANLSKEDSRKDKTFARNLVETFLIGRKWYNPRAGLSDPSIDLGKGWAYYEHVTLARRFATPSAGGRPKYERAEPGEPSDTKLFTPLTTPERALTEWGIGVALYFATVRIMALILLIGGLISIPNIIFYRSEDYTGTEDDNVTGGAESLPFFTLRGSMICTDRRWVEIVECTEGCERLRWAKSLNDTVIPDGTMFAQRTICQGAEFSQGIVNWAAFMFVAIATALLYVYQRKKEIRFDEDKSTSKDYSVKVSNPPSDAYDPDVWRDFFEQFSEKQVTVVTIALDNQELIHALTMRRVFQDKLRQLLPRGVEMDNAEAVSREVDAHVVERELRNRGCFEKLFQCFIVPLVRLPPFLMFIDAEVLVEKINTWTTRVRDLQKKKYNVASVFVTFETEEGQRAALTALKVEWLDLRRQNVNTVASSAAFQGRILKVRVPPEPSAVLWDQLNVKVRRKYSERVLTLLITIGLVALSGFVINRARSVNIILFSTCIAGFNFGIPYIIKLMNDTLEHHSSEGTRQRSIYQKITLFRWFNTAVLTKLITPFLDTLGSDRYDLLPSIDGVLLAEMVFTPVLRILDIGGFFRKHILAPRAPSQVAMNLNFTGTIYNLGERYTDFTKAFNPNAYFVGFVTLAIQYAVDKYCLLRLWYNAPLVGTQLADFNGRYFLSAAVVACAIFSSYAFAEFPYDNLCEADDEGLGQNQNITVELSDGTNGTIEVIGEDSPARFCEQNYLRLPGFIFPATPNKQPENGVWMTDSQERITLIYGWTSVAALIAFFVVGFGGIVINFTSSLFGRRYIPTGKDQKIDFSSLPEVFAYVPNVRAPGFLFPFLVVDIDDIDQSLIGWNDRNRSYDHWNLIYDVPYEGQRRNTKIKGNTRKRQSITEHADYEVSSKREPPKFPIFSIIKHYPPEWTRRADT